jgi:formylmethanofuran dehydrogenase subunit E
MMAYAVVICRKCKKHVKMGDHYWDNDKPVCRECHREFAEKHRQDVAKKAEKVK